jgi:transposase-like protein DUF772
MSRVTKPQVSFADLEFMEQGIFLEPHLQAISDFLDEHEEMIEKVRSDLARGLKNPATGRKGVTPSQVLRSLILMRVKDWDYRELRERINDGYTWRSFTDFLSQPVPKHHAFNRAFNRLTPETLQAVNELVVQAAVDLGLEDGNKLRVDTTFFEPHTDLIKRGKVQTPLEFGHKVFLAESAQGLITQYKVLNGNPADEDHVQPSLQHHRKIFGHAPDLYGTDRGFYSADDVRACKQTGSRW